MVQTKVAIIGCGTIANAAHGPSYQKNENARIAYCVDILPDRAQSLKEKFGDEETVALTDYHDFLADKSVTAVSVCVPNYLHHPITIDCLRAGKDVLCEKPAAITYALAKEMKAAADQTGRILNIGVVNRFNKAVMQVHDRIASGELGEVYQVYASFRQYRSIPGLGGPFTTKAMAGGGVLIDWGVHFLDLINYCVRPGKVLSVTGVTHSKLGQPLSEYVYEEMWAGPPNYDGVYDVEEFVSGLIRTDGPAINLNGAWAQNVNDKDGMFIEFLGTKGGVKLIYGKDYTFYTVKDGKLYEEKPEVPEGDMFYDELDAFLHASAAHEKIRSNIDNVLITAQMMQALYDSAACGRQIDFDKGEA